MQPPGPLEVGQSGGYYALRMRAAGRIVVSPFLGLKVLRETVTEQSKIP